MEAIRGKKMAAAATATATAAASNRHQQLPPPPPLPPHSRPFPPPSRAHPPSHRTGLEHIDREKTCPLLLRVFTKIGDHHKTEDFALRGKEPKNEIQIYTWKDATLRELTDLVKEVAPEARRRNAKLSFAFVYPDKRGHFILRMVGMTHSSARRPDDSQALGQLGFQIGDYLDVAIM